jgi:hypothetical protein
MPRVPLLDGAYQSRAIIPTSQRCINLYPEKNEDQQAPTPVTHFPTPGLVRKGTPLAPGVGRCVYRATNGELFTVVGGSVYYVSSDFVFHLIGTIPTLATPVIMADNGQAIVLVDGTPTAYAINIQPISLPSYPMHAFAPLNDENFALYVSSFGTSHVAYSDTFFVFNVRGRNQWFISLSLVTYGNLTQGDKTAPSIYKSFDPLDFASKIGSADPIQGLTTMHRNVWILGTLAGEGWYNSGAADFTYAALPGVYSERGCIAPYSIASEDTSVYWLSRSRQGKCVVLRWDASFQIEVISPPGIEAILGSFAMCDDAIGGCFQLLGHSYYIITFPTENRSFGVETQSKQWHELAWTGPNGLERHRSQGWCHAYDMVLTCDRVNGTLYQLDPFTFTDDGGPITRLRTIPHILNEGKRMRIDRVIADTQGGTLGGTMPGPYSKTIQQIIIDQGLTANLNLLLEAGSRASWPGQQGEQRWFDVSGGGYDFFTGFDSTVAINDPIFNGVVGGASLSEYWSFAGNQFFTYDSTNEPWMDAMHKAGAKFTVLTLVYPGIDPPPPSTPRFMGDANSATNLHNGFDLGVGPGGTVRMNIWNNGAAQTFDGTVITLGQWSVQAIAVDEAASSGLFLNAGTAKTFNAHYTNPSTLTATDTLQIGAVGRGVGAALTGTRLSFVAIWSVALTQAQLTALTNAIMANSQLPSARFSEPQIFLRISYDRGGSFQDALGAGMGNEGQYGELPWWPNLGIGRDIVLELSWSAPIDTALNGVFIEATPVGT